jgi:hypothetical protein
VKVTVGNVTSIPVKSNGAMIRARNLPPTPMFAVLARIARSWGGRHEAGVAPAPRAVGLQVRIDTVADVRQAILEAGAHLVLRATGLPA